MTLALQKHAAILDTGHKSISKFEWMFLLSIGYFSYFGILLLQAESALMEMVMCFVTILTISLFSYILADLDHPCHGCFKIKLQPMFKVADLLQKSYSRIVNVHGKVDIVEAGCISIQHMTHKKSESSTNQRTDIRNAQYIVVICGLIQ